MSLEYFFNPQSVAIVGASRKQGRVGFEILSAMHKSGYSGPVYPVNPSADTILDMKCYPELKAIGKSVELVIIVVASKFVPKVMQQCADIGTKAVVIISSGFKESSEKGAEREKEVIRIAKSANIRVIGPNCIGVIAPWNHLNASFAGEMPKAGNIGYFSQSGSILAAIIDMAKDFDMGFSRLVSIGNKADVDELDVIKALGHDENTKVIAGYLESIRDGDAFIRQAEQISRKKTDPPAEIGCYRSRCPCSVIAYRSACRI